MFQPLLSVLFVFTLVSVTFSDAGECASWGTDALPIGYEPSGLAYLGSDILLVVGDDTQLAVLDMSTDTVISYWYLGSVFGAYNVTPYVNTDLGDWEGVAWHNGRVIIGNEDPETLMQFFWNSSNVTQLDLEKLIPLPTSPYLDGIQGLAPVSYAGGTRERWYIPSKGTGVLALYDVDLDGESISFVEDFTIIPDENDPELWTARTSGVAFVPRPSEDHCGLLFVVNNRDKKLAVFDVLDENAYVDSKIIELDLPIDEAEGLVVLPAGLSVNFDYRVLICRDDPLKHNIVEFHLDFKKGILTDCDENRAERIQMTPFEVAGAALISILGVGIFVLILALVLVIIFLLRRGAPKVHPTPTEIPLKETREESSSSD